MESNDMEHGDTRRGDTARGDTAHGVTSCNDARRLIPGYLDGQLQEAQAAPLRKHLLDCQPCRASAQSEKNLSRWFVQPKSVAVPRDFAARVARRAFAGDRGERFSEPVLAGAGGGAVLSMRDEQRNLRFVLTMTAAAAALLLMVSLGIRSLSLPSGTSMLAENAMTIEQAHQALDRLNSSAATPQAGAKVAPKPVVEAGTVVEKPAAGATSPEPKK
jgi:hypothetical protein